MGSYTLTYNLSASQTKILSPTATTTGYFFAETSNSYYTLQNLVSGASIKVTNVSTTATASNGISQTLPTFSSVSSVTYRVTGNTLVLLQFTKADGGTISLNSQGGSFNSEQIAAMQALGSGAKMTVTGGRSLSFKTNATASDFDRTSSLSWYPKTLSRSPGKDPESTTRPVSSSTNQEVKASFATTVTFYINTDGTTGGTTPDISDTDDGGEGNYFNIEKGGVAVGQLCTGTTSAQKFEVNFPANFNAQMTAHNFKMSDGWHDLTLGKGITASTNTYGSSSGGAHYRVEGGHKVHVQASVKFNPLGSDNGYGKFIASGIPEEYCPSGKVYALAHVPVPNNASRTLYIIRCYVNPYGELWAEVCYANGSASLTSYTVEIANCQIDVAYEV